MRKANYQKRAERLVKQALKTKKRNKREIEKGRQNPNYKPKIKKAKKRWKLFFNDTPPGRLGLHHKKYVQGGFFIIKIQRIVLIISK